MEKCNTSCWINELVKGKEKRGRGLGGDHGGCLRVFVYLLRLTLLFLSQEKGSDNNGDDVARVSFPFEFLLFSYEL